MLKLKFCISDIVKRYPAFMVGYIYIHTLQDSFVVRMFDPHHSPMEIISELPLKLTRKCVDAFGLDNSDGGNFERKTICKCKLFCLVVVG